MNKIAGFDMMVRIYIENIELRSPLWQKEVLPTHKR